ncbi:MAG: hypothetical protein ABT01_06290 [Clostridium sp. SCN 57-10]|nr:MAG: hypothetical protein ABT01_06290 [Clostridium sp. SCN 57-10]
MNKKFEPETRVIERPSVLPYYAVGALWVLWALALPLYRIGHFLLVGSLSAAAFFVLRAVLPKQKIAVPVRRIESYTGDAAADALLRDGRSLVRELQDIAGKIDRAPQLVADARRGSAACIKMFDYVASRAQAAPQIRRLVSYNLPTIVKMARSYENMEEQGVRGGDVDRAMARVEQVMATAANAFEAQLGQLYAGEAVDISTDITVLEGMLAREGLTDQKPNESGGRPI